MESSVGLRHISSSFKPIFRAAQRGQSPSFCAKVASNDFEEKVKRLPHQDVKHLSETGPDAIKGTSKILPAAAAAVPVMIAAAPAHAAKVASTAQDLLLQSVPYRHTPAGAAAGDAAASAAPDSVTSSITNTASHAGSVSSAMSQQADHAVGALLSILQDSSVDAVGAAQKLLETVTHLGGSTASAALASAADLQAGLLTDIRAMAAALSASLADLRLSGPMVQYVSYMAALLCVLVLVRREGPTGPALSKSDTTRGSSVGSSDGQNVNSSSSNGGKGRLRGNYKPAPRMMPLGGEHGRWGAGKTPSSVEAATQNANNNRLRSNSRDISPSPTPAAWVNISGNSMNTGSQQPSPYPPPYPPNGWNVGPVVQAEIMQEAASATTAADTSATQRPLNPVQMAWQQFRSAAPKSAAPVAPTGSVPAAANTSPASGPKRSTTPPKTASGASAASASAAADAFARSQAAQRSRDLLKEELELVCEALGPLLAIVPAGDAVRPHADQLLQQLEGLADWSPLAAAAAAGGGSGGGGQTLSSQATYTQVFGRPDVHMQLHAQLLGGWQLMYASNMVSDSFNSTPFSASQQIGPVSTAPYKPTSGPRTATAPVMPSSTVSRTPNNARPAGTTPSPPGMIGNTRLSSSSTWGGGASKLSPTPQLLHFSNNDASFSASAPFSSLFLAHAASMTQQQSAPTFASLYATHGLAMEATVLAQQQLRTVLDLGGAAVSSSISSSSASGGGVLGALLHILTALPAGWGLTSVVQTFHDVSPPDPQLPPSALAVTNSAEFSLGPLGTWRVQARGCWQPCFSSGSPMRSSSSLLPSAVPSGGAAPEAGWKMCFDSLALQPLSFPGVPKDRHLPEVVVPLPEQLRGPTSGWSVTYMDNSTRITRGPGCVFLFKRMANTSTSSIIRT